MKQLTAEQVALLQAGVDAMPEDHIPMHLAEARAALAKCPAPYSPETTNDLYYPLLFLVEAVEADRRSIDLFDAGVAAKRQELGQPEGDGK